MMPRSPHPMQPKILIVEDETHIIELLRYNLAKAGFAVIDTGNGEEAMLLIAEQQPDLILLDWMLPAMSGIEFCRRLRRDPAARNLPVIMITARGEEADRLRGLDSGADDYIVKPFSPTEVVARVKAVLRRARPAQGDDRLGFADVEIDLAEHRVTRGGAAVDLGPTEFRLLRHLMAHPRRVFSRAQLLDAVWGHDIHVEERTVDVHIGRLRKALNAGDRPDLVRTVRAAGYALDTETR
ncbi:MAG: phosphate regulon transcriptional regulatory protein PhoB [Alphaproteobacteria bacterium]|nr:phosphate regulon transcriptional regulatory protein PhoB [Alphaproteobacteria bacterium]